MTRVVLRQSSPSSHRTPSSRPMTDLGFAVRQLRKSPAFTWTALLTLTLGIGANTAIFSVVNAVVLRPLPYPEPERLVTLWERSPRRGVDQDLVCPPNLADWKQRNHVFEDIAYW